MNKLNSVNPKIKFEIKAIDFINDKILDDINIEVFVKSNNEKIGLLQYFCANPVKKSIHLIYTKFKDETNFPAPYIYSDLQVFLNTKSHNQLFIEYVVTTENFDVSNIDKQTFMTGLNTLEALYIGLLKLKYASSPNIDINFIPNGYDMANDFYFITNLEKVSKYDSDGTTPLGHIGGGHFLNKNGGLLLKTPPSLYSETQIETDTHEFGHWVGLPHTFEEKNDAGIIIPKPVNFFTIHINKGESQHNFMDYNIKRKTFFKIQLLNRQNTSN